MRAVTVIPARFASTRLPGKPLLEIAGKPMIQWVYERASKARRAQETWVATDDQRVYDAVKSFGGQVLMTPDTLASGTDRVGYVAEKIPADIYVNCQGDEPLINPNGIDLAIDRIAQGDCDVATLMTPLLSEDALKDPSTVKVIADRKGRAIYFSRLPIPYGKPGVERTGDFICYQHMGLYVFRKESLKRFQQMEVSALELAEGLEQLRFMENGMTIGIAAVNDRSVGVDTPSDLEKVRKIFLEKRIEING